MFGKLGAAALIGLLGLYVFCGGQFSWKWFVDDPEDPGARRVVGLLGRKGARDYYRMLGLFIMGFALFSIFL